VLATGLAPAAAAPQSGTDGLSSDERQAVSIGEKVTKRVTKPRGANPFLALVPDPRRVDYAGWNRYLDAKAEAKAATRERLKTPLERRALVADPLLVDEEEPAGIRGANDSTATAQQVPEFGTGAGETPGARILGSLSPERVASDAVRPNVENDGAIPLARGTGIGRTRDGITTTGRIGDGPHGRAGSGRGDFDFYRLRGIRGEVLEVDINTPTGRLDSMVAVFNAAGQEVALNDDSGGSLDSFLRYKFRATGNYYVMTTGFFAFPNNPFRSGSGSGAASQGPYRVRISMGEDDVDFYAVQLSEGDVLGASVEGSAAEVTVWDPGSVNVHGSDQDATFILPMDSPLPGGGNAVSEHVADEDGWHYVSVANGRGRYDLTVEAYRPGLEAGPPVQTIFLDFDGARVNTGIWGGPGVRTLSPLSAFLGRWGLSSAQYDDLVTAIVEETQENLEADMVDSGLNDDFQLRILNSRDDADPWGQPNVSRVIVGGTIEQSGIPTIGIAQSIDPGNYETEESALVLLDVLSDPAGGEFGDASLNFYLRPRSDRVAFVGQAVGNVVSHEAGHFFGDWHVDQFNARPNLMDQGGNFSVMFGVGPDRVGGTADDVDVDFGEDVFNPNEGFTGIQDTLSRLAFALTG
jgi:hypothetical protein